MKQQKKKKTYTNQVFVLLWEEGEAQKCVLLYFYFGLFFCKMKNFTCISFVFRIQYQIRVFALYKLDYN
jgi:hypothetical protein